MSLMNLSDHEKGDRAPGSDTSPSELADIEAQYLERERPALETRIHSGANWFLWVAGLSLVNSVILLFDGRWSFLAGLGITQLIDGLASGLSETVGPTGTVVAMVLNVSVFGAFVLFGVQAKKRQSWAFIIGMILYALDGFVFLMVPDWFSIAFHVFALYCIYKGLSAHNQLTELERSASVTNPQPG